MPTYQEQIAAWRAQRAQQQVAERVNQIASEYRDAVRERDQAIANNDVETAEWRDADCQQLEQEYNQYVPPQPPQMDPRLAQFAQRNADYLNKLRNKVGPERADKFLKWVDQRLVRMGHQPNTPSYFKWGRDMLELDSERVTGVPYDSKDQALTANQAAKISGLSAEEYNNAAKVIAPKGVIAGSKRNREIQWLHSANALRMLRPSLRHRQMLRSCRSLLRM
jgi:hypothetical protein